MNIPFVPAHSSNYSRGRTASIQWIVVHYTANDGDTDAGNAHYFQGANRKASAHYFVDEDSVTQSVRDTDTAWHCGASTYYNGCRNANSIGVEMCSDKTGGKYIITEATVARTVDLVRQLMKKYNIPVSRVCRHYDVTHKVCPEPWVRNPQLWTDFKKRLEEPDMTEAQVKQIIEKDREANLYNSVEECPAWARPTVQKLVNKGFLQGTSDGSLELTEDLIRVLVVNDRAHLYGD